VLVSYVNFKLYTLSVINEGQFLVIIVPGPVAKVLVLNKPTTCMQFIAENVYLDTITQSSYMIIICR
jgi:hypothetical protein